VGHRVERAEGLIHQQHRRLLGEAARDLQPLLHAARELTRITLRMRVEPDLLQERRDTLRAFGAWDTRGLESEGHIAGGVAPGKQRLAVILEAMATLRAGPATLCPPIAHLAPCR